MVDLPPVIDSFTSRIVKTFRNTLRHTALIFQWIDNLELLIANYIDKVGAVVLLTDDVVAMSDLSSYAIRGRYAVLLNNVRAFILNLAARIDSIISKADESKVWKLF